MSRLILLLGLITASCMMLVSAHAELVERTLDVNGEGSSREAARRNALIEAIRQVRGVVMDSKQEIRSTSRDVASNSNGVIRVDAKLSDLTSDGVSLATRGVIKRYEIISEQADNAGKWSSNLRVTCWEYVAESDGSRTLVILPFRALGELKATKADQLRDSLTTAFTQARRLHIVALGQTLGSVGQGESSSHDLARIGHEINADLVLTGTLHRFELDPFPRMAVHYEVIEVATGEIRWANDIEFVPDPLLSPNEESLVAYAADAIATSILEIIHPVRVLFFDSQFVYLNQGGRRVLNGDLLTVFSGSVIRADPDPTRSRLTRIDGEPACMLSVQRVQEKYAICRMVEGDASKLQIGQIIRRASPQSALAYRRRIEETAVRENELSGKAPPLEIVATPLGQSWSINLRNNSATTLRIKEYTAKGSPRIFQKELGPQQEDNFNLVVQFLPGDRLEVRCQGFENPKIYFFP